MSPGHWPFCARASISVPGAPVSSLVTGSQVLVLKPGAEICAPVWVATALLCTFQPPDPRFVMLLAPVSAGDPRLAPATAARGARWAATARLRAADGAGNGAACTLEASQISAMAGKTITAGTTAARGRAGRVRRAGAGGS